MPKTNEVLFNFHIDKTLRDEFHIWCIRNEVSMKSVLIESIQKTLRQDKVDAPTKKLKPRRPEGFLDAAEQTLNWEDSY